MYILNQGNRYRKQIVSCQRETVREMAEGNQKEQMLILCLLMSAVGMWQIFRQMHCIKWELPFL